MQEVFEFLSDPSSYADYPSAMEVIETHISWVFLTDRFAYKLKKPVRFDFLDFSTPAARRKACHDEVRLNRRLASNVYIAVLPITRDSDGRLALNGQGEAIDWVVQMRRLPANETVSVKLQERRLTAENVESIARHLVNFYVGLPSKPLSADLYRQTLERHVRANGVQLKSALTESAKVRRAQSAQLRYLCVQAGLFNSRVAAGRIVDGHGDLRPEHIYADHQPVVIDCIEFSEEYRTVDIADDLSFLAMECERLGDGDLGRRTLERYQQICGDHFPKPLSDFYRSYRACVRAKVALLSARQQQGIRAKQSDELFRQYLDLADRHATELGPPMLLIVGGLMGTGKSTLAAKLCETFDVISLSTDHIRRSIFRTSEKPAGYGEGNYEPRLRNQVYDELLRQAGDVLASGESAILDGSFLSRACDNGRISSRIKTRPYRCL